MSYHNRVKRTYERAKGKPCSDEVVAFKAACLVNMAIAAVADDEVQRLKLALRQIAGDAPWPDHDLGYNDLARAALNENPTPDK